MRHDIGGIGDFVQRVKLAPSDSGHDRYLFAWKCRTCGVFFKCIEDVFAGEKDPPDPPQARWVDVQAMLGNPMQMCPQIVVRVTSAKHELRLVDAAAADDQGQWNGFYLRCDRCQTSFHGGRFTQVRREIEATARRADDHECKAKEAVS